MDTIEVVYVEETSQDWIRSRQCKWKRQAKIVNTIEVVYVEERSQDTLRASLASTFLQRKDVVNRCLESEAKTAG